MSGNRKRYPAFEPAAVAERRQQVVDMTKAGMSASEIATRVGITERSVYRIRYECGVSRSRPPAVTAEELAAAKALLEDGASRAEAARTIGRSTTVLERAFPEKHWSRAEQAEYLAAVRRFRQLVAS